MRIGSIGYNYQHKEAFVMDYPQGIGCHLLLLIKEPSVFYLDGQKLEADKNSFVLIAPETPCRYHGKENVYTDDWIYFDLEEGDEELFASLGIPKNEILHLGRIDELSLLVQFMACEHYSTEESHAEIERCYTRIFLLKLGRLIADKSSHSLVSSDRSNRFIQLRNMIYAAPGEIADVDSLANLMNMSRSGFQHAYKKMFGLNIMADIVNARMAYARQLLISTNYSIKDISQKCGYSNEYAFLKRFKLHYGQTPTQFRSIL